MTKIFISYAKKDTRKLAIDLAKALNAIDGVSVWVDKSLKVGRSWELQIQKHIDECDTMIVLYSPDINRHKRGETASYVLTEIHYAKRIVKKHIIPVMAIETAPPMALALEQYIDFTLDGLTLNDLVVALCDELHVDPTRKQAQAADTSVPTRQPPKFESQTVGERPVSEQRLTKPKLVKPKDRPRATADAVREIIGDPFEWCEVPAGEFIYSELITLPTFYMAKYPITYKQFRAFIGDKSGFDDLHWWRGLAEKSNKPGDQEWKINDHPRENVSWYDAMAFCRWLSWRLGSGYGIDNIGSWAVRLPTEFEWEKAARGTDGRFFPYGNTFDKSKSNTSESGIRKTTPVTRYPQGASPYGVLDMSGNVLEWCLTDDKSPSRSAEDENISSNSRRVLRGGSWSYLRFNARVASRYLDFPYSRSSFFGFRLCCVPAL